MNAIGKRKEPEIGGGDAVEVPRKVGIDGGRETVEVPPAVDQSIPELKQNQ